MADTKTTALTAITGPNVDDLDLLMLVDVSDTTMAASGTNKKLTIAEASAAFTNRDINVDQWVMVGGLFL